MAEVEVITFGCRLNAFESEIIRGAAAGPGDTIVINTCAVTAEAERQARQAIRRARRENPDARIVVTGCAATLSPQRYAALGGVDLVLDNEAKLRPESYHAGADACHSGTVQRAGPGIEEHEPLSATEDVAPPVSPVSLDSGFAGIHPRPGMTASGRARAYLQVQQGCDHRCTFCIIPYARGPSRSVPPEHIAAQARELAAQGCREIVLTGVDLTAYGADLPERPTLGRMVTQLLAATPELSRLRLSSLDPSEIDDELWAAFGAEKRLMPHLHFSFQSGDDLILKRMKRRHSRAEAVAAMRRARSLRPEVAIGADLIAGFPTESEEMFRRSLDLVEEGGIAFLHVFPYSPRLGTPAARMPQLDPALVRERAARLRAAGGAALAADLSRRVGAVADVLVEASGRGRAECYAAVRFEGPARPGAVVPLRLVGVEQTKLIGVPA